MMLEAIILAGGFGARLHAVVADVPKPMAPINGVPFLEILLANLAKKGFSRIVLSLGHMAGTISGYFGATFQGIDLVYVVEDEPLGTGGAIRLAMSQCREDHIYIFNGDTFSDLEISALEKQWQSSHNPIVVTRQVADCSRFGLIDTDGAKVLAFSEKSKEGSGLINAGCYVFPSDLLDGVSGGAFSIETDFLAHEVSLRQFDIFVTEGTFIDIGIPSEFARAQIELLEYME